MRLVRKPQKDISLCWLKMLTKIDSMFKSYTLVVDDFDFDCFLTFPWYKDTNLIFFKILNIKHEAKGKRGSLHNLHLCKN